MPTSKEKYPANWKAFSESIRIGRARGRCECMGECGLHRTTPGPRRCVEQLGQPAKWAKGKVILSVAHLNHDGGPCRCEPLCANPDHVKAMCSRCHLRLDVPRHMLNASETRRKKAGQLALFPEVKQ